MEKGVWIYIHALFFGLLKILFITKCIIKDKKRPYSTKLIDYLDENTN